EVVLYYPEKLPPNADIELYLALAQVVDKSNLPGGIAQLADAIARHAPARAEFYFALAEAWRNHGELAKSLPPYREAVRRKPDFAPGWQKLGSALRRSGKHAEAVEILKRAAAMAPQDAFVWHELALAYRAQGNIKDAIGTLQHGISLDPELPEAH